MTGIRLVNPPATPDTIVSLALLSRRGQRFAFLDDKRDQHLARRRPRTFCPMNLFSRDEVGPARFHRHSRRALLVLDNSALLYIGEEFTGMGVSRFSGARRSFHHDHNAFAARGTEILLRQHIAFDLTNLLSMQDKNRRQR